MSNRGGMPPKVYSLPAVFGDVVSLVSRDAFIVHTTAVVCSDSRPRDLGRSFETNSRPRQNAVMPLDVLGRTVRDALPERFEFLLTFDSALH